MITVREAIEADAPTMSRVLTASIVELCGPDHHGDSALIADWTRNKTEAGVRAMLTRAGATLLVAMEHDIVLAVGCITDGNRIGLNYVDPAFRFRGASIALLADMERRIRMSGHHEARLESTATAREFYLARGWQEATPRMPSAGHPMRKLL